MKLPRRRLLHFAVGIVAASGVRLGWAQVYPTRPVRIIVGFPAGGGADIQVRIIAQWLSEQFRQSVVVENRPGAATNLAIQTAINSPPDGYTLVHVSFTTNSVSISSVTLHQSQD